MAVAKMAMALGGAKASETGAEAKGEAYMAALEDVPHWATAAAIRLWYRGEPRHPRHDKGERYRFEYAPDPATLRRIALGEWWKVRGRAIAFRELVAAVPEQQFSEDHCQKMRDGLRDLMRQLTTKKKESTP